MPTSTASSTRSAVGSTARANRRAGPRRPWRWPGLVAATALLAGCSVVPVPTFSALRGQGEREHAWDVQDCRAEAAYQTHYSPGDSPLANLCQKIFFWGGAGASLGGLITGVPVIVGSSQTTTNGLIVGAGQATNGLIAGAGAGGIVGSLESISGQRRFEGAFVDCMQSKGYAMTPRVEKAEGAPIAVTP